ncbi:MAG: hypothetical protein ABJL44_11900 [Algibacter sp.]
MKKFSDTNGNQKCLLSYKERGELEIEFELTFSSIDGIKVNTNGIAINPDPEGLASLEEFDPSGDYNPINSLNLQA